MLKKLSLIALSLTALNANASSFGAVECYSLAHGENGQGSRKTVMIPAFNVNGSNKLRVHVTNIDSQPLNITIDLFDENGQKYTPTDYSLSGNFNTNANSPLDGQTDGIALLKPLNIGLLEIDETNHTGPLTAQVSWQIDNCELDELFFPSMKPRVSLSIEHITSNGSRDIQAVNNFGQNHF